MTKKSEELGALLPFNTLIKKIKTLLPLPQQYEKVQTKFLFDEKIPQVPDTSEQVEAEKAENTSSSQKLLEELKKELEAGELTPEKLQAVVDILLAKQKDPEKGALSAEDSKKLEKLNISAELLHPEDAEALKRLGIDNIKSVELTKEGRIHMIIFHEKKLELPKVSIDRDTIVEQMNDWYKSGKIKIPNANNPEQFDEVEKP